MRRVIWTDPENGTRHSGRTDNWEADRETYLVLLDDGGEAEAFDSELEWI